ncbi:MAG TPA: carbohydrate ABC transporter permease [Acidimicrobiales bacterium]|nr:carbohydrate ABC transporter permease [Acidimicrobiales bacterium]
MSSRTYQHHVRRALGYAVLVLFALIFIAPFIITVFTSFKTDSDATLHSLDPVPHPATLSAWQQIFGIGSSASVADVPRWLFNSAFVAVIITISRVFLDSLAGYALARLQFRGRKLIFGFIVATMAVPGVVLLIPQFLVLKELHLFNSYPGMIIPIAVDAVGIFLMRQFFLQVPVALEESGRIDGASTFQIFWMIVLPVVRAGLITLTIISFQASWNQYQFFLIATISPKYYTLTTGLANIIGGGLSAGNQFPLKLGASLVTIIPMALMFFLLQKHLVRGRLSGAVKG